MIDLYTFLFTNPGHRFASVRVAAAKHNTVTSYQMACVLLGDFLQEPVNSNREVNPLPGVLAHYMGKLPDDQPEGILRAVERT